ncbi:MAG: hypothetical protein IT431_05265 [Phycisphaerales bacterium]|nr:hypothetical protein [Phycisphaerales bacterium]
MGLGGWTVAAAQQAVDDREAPTGREVGQETLERWQIQKSEDPPTPEELADKLEQYFEGATAFRVRESAEQDGVLRFRAVSLMTADALRTEMYNPDGSLYAAVGWFEGVAYEYRPAMAMPDGTVFTQVLTQSRGLDWAEIPSPMLFPFSDGCQVGDLFQSWLARTEQEVRVETQVRWLRESQVLGEALVEGQECWVVDRSFLIPADDGTESALGNLYFVDKGSGHLVLWVATQSTSTHRNERVHRYQEVSVLEAIPDVDWRLRDLAAGAWERAQESSE